MAKNIFIIGISGSGKSSVGKNLAAELGLEFYDSDKVIEERAGADIPWIFDIEGEEGFREREMKVIDDLTQKQGIVLATGGGAILRAENRNHLGARGFVIYLKCSIQQLVKRTSMSNCRPLLLQDPRKTYEKMLATRGPLYDKLTDLVVDTYNQSSVTISRKITKQLRREYGF